MPEPQADPHIDSHAVITGAAHGGALGGANGNSGIATERSVQARPPGTRPETESEKKAREANERKERIEEGLIPQASSRKAIDFGITHEDGNRKRDEIIDLGGEYSMDDARTRYLEYGEQINLDRELYERISGPLEYFYQERVKAREAGKSDFEDISKLSPCAQAALEDYTIWREKYQRIKDLRESKDIIDRNKYRQARIFSSGLEVQRALVFLEQTEIVATHALGYELTNGGRQNLSFGLTNEQIELIERGNIPDSTKLAIHKILQALELDTPKKQMEAMKATIIALAPATATAAITTLATCNPLIGLAVGAGTGIAVAGTEKAYHDWVLTFDEPAGEERVRFNLKFRPNAIRSDPQSRIVDSPMGQFFLGRGEPKQGYASSFIKKSEETRHAIYRRLGLRVGSYRNFDWNNLTFEQEYFVKNILKIKKPKTGFLHLGHSWAALDQSMKDYIENEGTGKDLWMVDLNPTNMSISSTDKSAFHSRVRHHIQDILKERKYDKSLPSRQISSSDIYYDFSNLSPKERNEIMVEAYNRLATDICSKEGGEVLQRIMLRAEGRDEALAKLSESITATQAGKTIDSTTEITPEMVKEEQRRLAEARVKATAITNHGTKITELDQQIATEQTTRNTAENEYQAALTQHGENKPNTADCTGNIRQIREKIDQIEAKITAIESELGSYSSKTRKYSPPNSAYAQFHELDAKYNTLQSSLQAIDQEISIYNSPKSYDPGKLSKAFADRNKIHKQMTDIEQKRSAANTRLQSLLSEKQAKETERNTEQGRIGTEQGAVTEKLEARNATDRKIASLKTQRQDIIAELKRLTGFSEEYGAELQHILLSQANADIVKIEKELQDKGIPFEATAGEIKIKTEVDKKKAEGMAAIQEAGRSLSNAMKTLWKEYDAESLTDPNKCYESLLRIIWGKEAYSPEKRALYEQLLSKSTIAEVLFKELQVEGRGAQFFHGDAEGRQAFQTSRINNEQIQTLTAQIGNLKSDKGIGWENQVKILEGRLHGLQDMNVKLLNRLFDKYVPSYLGHNRFTDGEFVRILVDRMIENANNLEPFTGTVRYGESINPNISPEGTLLIRPPDIHPTDNSLINRGGITWTSPETYRVSRQPVQLKIETPISRTGRPQVNVEIRTQNVRALHAVLPPTLAQIPPGSPIADELNRIGILNQLYDAAGNKVSNRTAAFRNLIADKDKNRQINETVWKISPSGLNNAADLGAWLTGGNYNLGGSEANRYFRSVANAVSETPIYTDKEIVRRFAPVRQGNYEVVNERGELRMRRYNAAGAIETSVSLHDLLYTLDNTQRKAIISQRDLNDILNEVGQNLFESTRLRKS